MTRSVLLEVLRTRLSPYVTLVERRVDVDGRVESFHSLSQADYVTVLAVMGDGLHIGIVGLALAAKAFRAALCNGGSIPQVITGLA